MAKLFSSKESNYVTHQSNPLGIRVSPHSNQWIHVTNKKPGGEDNASILNVARSRKLTYTCLRLAHMIGLIQNHFCHWA